MPRRSIRRRRAEGGCLTYVIAALSVAALVVYTAYLVNSSYNPFLYFRF